MGNKLEGRIPVITGGNSGIGLATAKRFVSDGAYVLSQVDDKMNLILLYPRSVKTLLVFRVMSRILQILIGCILR